MDTGAGWSRQDGSGDDLTAHQAWRLIHTSKPTFETAAHCPYALTLSTWKDGTEWDAQQVTTFECYMGVNTKHHCRSDRPTCQELATVQCFPQSASAKAARTGLPST